MPSVIHSQLFVVFVMSQWLFLHKGPPHGRDSRPEDGGDDLQPGRHTLIL